MAEADTCQTCLLCGECLVMLELAGEVEVGLCGDDLIEEQATGSGTDGGGFDELFGRADEADGFSAGAVFNLFYQFVERRGPVESADTAEAEPVGGVVEPEAIVGGRLVGVCLFHGCDTFFEYRRRDDSFKSYFGHLLDNSFFADGRICAFEGEETALAGASVAAMAVVSDVSCAGGKECIRDFFDGVGRDINDELVGVTGGVGDIIADGFGVTDAEDFGEAVVYATYGSIEGGVYCKEGNSGADKLIDDAARAV